MMRRLLLPLALLLLLAPPVGAQVAYDGETVSTDALSAENAAAANHTSAGSNRYALVILGWSPASTATVSTITYGGTTMGAALVAITDANDQRVAIYGRAAPPTGSTAIAVSFADNAYGGMAVISFSGVDQATPTTDTDSQTGAMGTDPSLTLTTAVGEVLVNALKHFSVANYGSGANQTQRAAVEDGSFGETLQVETQAGTDGGVMTFDGTGTNSTTWAHVALSLKASGGGAAAVVRSTLVGVGP